MKQNQKKNAGNIIVEKYKKSLSKPLSQRTVTLLLKKDKVLLGLKSRGFGKGNYLGIGGKIEADKDNPDQNRDVLSTAKVGAQREIQEEIGVTVELEDLKSMGVLNFYFPYVENESWNQEVFVFVAKKWQGTPTAQTDENDQVEIVPEWFQTSEIPLNKMWDDAKYWLPLVLEEKHIDGEFFFNQNLEIDQYTIK